MVNRFILTIGLKVKNFFLLYTGDVGYRLKRKIKPRNYLTGNHIPSVEFLTLKLVTNEWFYYHKSSW